ncbi:rCG54153, partial [Rattus norvegicus]
MPHLGDCQAGNEMFKYVSLWGTFLIQITTT